MMDWFSLVPKFVQNECEHRLYRKDNNRPTRGIVRIKEVGDNDEVLRVHKFNLIVTGMKESLSRCIAGDSATNFVDGFKVGTGTNAPDVTDTDLQIVQFTKNVVTHTYPGLDSVLFTLTLEKLEGNGNAFTEAALFSDIDGTPRMNSRVVFSPINKDSSIKLIFEWEYIF